MLLVENAEGQNKKRIVGVNILHPMIAAFIDINDEIAVAPRRCDRAFLFLDDGVEVQLEKRELLVSVLIHDGRGWQPEWGNPSFLPAVGGYP